MQWEDAAGRSGHEDSQCDASSQGVVPIGSTSLYPKTVLFRLLWQRYVMQCLAYKEVVFRRHTRTRLGRTPKGLATSTNVQESRLGIVACWPKRHLRYATRSHYGPY